MDKQDRISQLEQKKRQMDEQYNSLLAKKEVTEEQLAQLKYEFEQGRKYKSLLRFVHPSNMKKFVRTTGAYILGRRNRKQLYSSAYKRKQASNDLKKYKYALYNEGFIDKTI